MQHPKSDTFSNCDNLGVDQLQASAIDERKDSIKSSVQVKNDR